MTVKGYDQYVGLDQNDSKKIIIIRSRRPGQSGQILGLADGLQQRWLVLVLIQVELVSDLIRILDQSNSRVLQPNIE